MKKLFLLTALAGLLSFGASAQTTAGNKLGVGLEFGLPVGDWSDGMNIGFGGSGIMHIPISSSKLYGTINAGFINFKSKEVNGFTYDYGAIPLKAGIKYYFVPNFYGAAELGAAIGTNDGASTAFAYSPGIGVDFPVSDKTSIDLGARYEAWSANSVTNGFVGIRAAFNFGL
ncbi:hypothetical protein C7T94_17865 [Pedobacter yulinensis]|uniref:Uncharacterized protein n=1 Tax=Pedobacter yulinensis TaxID=2126353 RepID=A0A2T3HHC9_9SPHI|nr:outer membrane beta-barrel protein [Pedobacter yulinensis]PST81848.1 hypothetical protein C7T94_17865 [Pedobacter yulinensis]